MYSVETVAYAAVVVPWTDLPHDQAQGCATDLRFWENSLNWSKGVYFFLPMSKVQGVFLDIVFVSDSRLDAYLL